jgi:hypothetical protein
LGEPDAPGPEILHTGAEPDIILNGNLFNISDTASLNNASTNDHMNHGSGSGGPLYVKIINGKLGTPFWAPLSWAQARALLYRIAPYVMANQRPLKY